MPTDLIVGILSNPHSQVSVLSSVYLQRILEKISVPSLTLTLEDVIEGNIRAGLVFNVYYGEIGDGGIAAALLEKQDIAYVGNSSYSCMLMLNKVVAKIKFQQAGLLTPKFWYKSNIRMSTTHLTDDITNFVAYPMLAKPVNGAAGANISFIRSEIELSLFIESHRQLVSTGYYFFEEFIAGKEVTAGHVNSLQTLPVMELRLLPDTEKNTFSSSHKEKIVPAQLSADMYEKIQRTALELHAVFKCTAFSRTDMVYDEVTDSLYILEINTNPSLVGHSIFMELLRAGGIGEEDLLKHLIKYSLDQNSH